MIGSLTLAALLASPLAQVDWPTRSGFDIVRYTDACQFDGYWPVAGRADVQVSIYHAGDVRLLLVSSSDWTNRPDEEIQLQMFVDRKGYSAPAKGLPRDAYRNGFSIAVPEEFLTEFAGGSDLIITRGDVVVAHLGLQNTGLAVADLRSCVRRMERLAADQAAEEAEVEYIARDPFAGLETAESRVAGSLWAQSPVPDFPDRAAERGITSASVTLDCHASPSGALSDCNVVTETSIGAGFAQAALAATRSARLSPTAVQNLPASSRQTFTVQFSAP